MTFSVQLGNEIRYVTCVGLPMGWVNSPYVFTKFMRPVVQHLRAPGVAAEMAAQRASGASRRFLYKTLDPNRRGLRVLPYMDQDELELLADFAQVLFAVVTLDRNSTSNAIGRRDITFHAGGGFTYLERVTKGKDADKEKRLREVPPEAFPRVQDVLRAFNRYHNQLQRNTRTGLFFGVGSRRVNLDAALHRALDSISISPPPGLCYSSHSCRKCATLVRAAGVALDDVTDWGGWSQLGGTVHTYIDKSYRLRGAALAFARELFGWLRHHDET